MLLTPSARNGKTSEALTVERGNGRYARQSPSAGTVPCRAEQGDL